jgi:hypothetical protein
VLLGSSNSSVLSPLLLLLLLCFAAAAAAAAALCACDVPLLLAGQIIHLAEWSGNLQHTAEVVCGTWWLPKDRAARARSLQSCRADLLVAVQ